MNLIKPIRRLTSPVKKCILTKMSNYQTLLVYCCQLASGAIKLAGDLVQGNNSKQNSNYITGGIRGHPIKNETFSIVQRINMLDL